MKKLLLVVACALIDQNNRILLTERQKGKNLAGLWEFPGGKVEQGEGPEAALIRELDEELGVRVSAECLIPLTFASHAYDDFHLLMPLYVCRRFEGVVEGREGQNFKWLNANDLQKYPMPAADLPLIEPLCVFLSNPS